MGLPADGGALRKEDLHVRARLSCMESCAGVWAMKLGEVNNHFAKFFIAMAMWVASETSWPLAIRP